MKVDKSIRIAFTVDWPGVFSNLLAWVVGALAFMAIGVTFHLGWPNTIAALVFTLGMTVQRILDKSVTVGSEESA